MKLWFDSNCKSRTFKGAFLSSFPGIPECRQRLAYVLKIVTPMFEKKDTKFRKVISPEQQLIITLRFLESAVISTIRLESRKSNSVKSLQNPGFIISFQTCRYIHGYTKGLSKQLKMRCN